MALKYMKDASVVKLFLMCLKMEILYLIELHILLICFLKLRVWSKWTPRYFISVTMLSFCPLTQMLGIFLTLLDLAKYIPTVFSIFNVKQEDLSQLLILSMAEDNLVATCSISLHVRR